MIKFTKDFSKEHMYAAGVSMTRNNQLEQAR